MIGGASGASGAGGAMPISGCNHRAQDLCVNVSFGLAAPCAGCSAGWLAVWLTGCVVRVDCLHLRQ